MENETPEEREARKLMFMERATAIGATRAEAAEKFEKENPEDK